MPSRNDGCLYEVPGEIFSISQLGSGRSKFHAKGSKSEGSSRKFTRLNLSAIANRFSCLAQTFGSKSGENLGTLKEFHLSQNLFIRPAIKGLSCALNIT